MTASPATAKRSARKVELVDPGGLTLDYDIYPRVRENGEHIRELIYAMEMDAALPPLIVWEENRKIIDGFHRYYAHCRHFHGDAVPLLVEYRDYSSSAEAFKDSLALNAAHGLRLRAVDRERSLQLARGLGMTPEMVAVAIKLPIRRLTKRRTESVTKRAMSPSRYGEAIPLDGQHDAEVETALVELFNFMGSSVEIGSGGVPDLLRDVNAAKKDGGLRFALIRTAAAFVWWAARAPKEAA